MCVNTAEIWVEREQNIFLCANDGMFVCVCVCVEKCTCLNYCLLGVVGLAMVVVCTYGADCIP